MWWLCSPPHPEARPGTSLDEFIEEQSADPEFREGMRKVLEENIEDKNGKTN